VYNKPPVRRGLDDLALGRVLELVEFDHGIPLSHNVGYAMECKRVKKSVISRTNGEKKLVIA
jgi:hypothetical protein